MSLSSPFDQRAPTGGRHSPVAGARSCWLGDLCTDTTLRPGLDAAFSGKGIDKANTRAFKVLEITRHQRHPMFERCRGDD